jgi:hypothetical protein
MEPLAAGEPLGTPLGNALAPLPGYVDRPPFFGDALAAAPTGADPTATPLSAALADPLSAPPPALTGTDPHSTNTAGTNMVGTNMVGANMVGTDVGRFDLHRPGSRIDFSGTDLGAPAERDLLDPPTIGLVIPPGAVHEAERLRAERAPESRGGRYELGLPRGWDPPSVPANRGWSRAVPAAPARPDRGARQPSADRPSRWPPPAPGSRATGIRQSRPHRSERVREIPPEVRAAMERRLNVSSPSTLGIRIGAALVFSLVAVGTATQRSWATTAIFAGLALILIRPRPNPARQAAAAEKRRRAGAPEWPRPIAPRRNPPGSGDAGSGG